jgi:spore coat protein U-like protein
MTQSFSTTKFNLAALALSLIALTPGLSLAQVTGSFRASANVVQTLSIESAGQLSFGDFIPTTQDGTVVVSSVGSYARTSTNVKLVNSNAGTVSTVVITGAPDSTYTVSLPSTFNLGGIGGASMEISSFSTNLVGSRGVIPDAGRGSFQIGGTLKVVANQPGGNYSASVPITINYP